MQRLEDVHSLTDSNIRTYHELFVYSYSLYLTIRRDDDNPRGALLHADMVQGSPMRDLYEAGELLLQESTIDPRGVCTFHNMSGKDCVLSFGV